MGRPGNSNTGKRGKDHVKLEKTQFKRKMRVREGGWWKMKEKDKKRREKNKKQVGASCAASRKGSLSGARKKRDEKKGRRREKSSFYKWRDRCLSRDNRFPKNGSSKPARKRRGPKKRVVERHSGKRRVLIKEKPRWSFNIENQGKEGGGAGLG